MHHRIFLINDATVLPTIFAVIEEKEYKLWTDDGVMNKR